MIDFRHLNQVWSEDACRLTASHFRQLADAWERRADHIRNYRGNLRSIDDKAPALRAANRVLSAYENGLDPASQCRNICRKNFLKFEQVWQLFEHKRAAFERDKRKKRNQAMIKDHITGQFSQRDLAKRYGISHGQVSKIVSPKPPERRKAPRAQKKDPPQRVSLEVKPLE